ncbi:ABC transporter ATP-binding protein [Streptomyces beijiangensis]|uniref:ABC transporter ATP-binding protein n=1 Tax=Streptomyces beijiangensis TaxID=163361 RepID=A0A939FD40_9ACTN|nr:ABC transporter ATP-binding protein [Streptomyces beijiangensis]MBO0517071.1 ABC transporter ATP-binding protein [Streptomyces beijiangensis]
MIRLEGAGKTFGRRGEPVLSEIDLSVGEGEFVCLLGGSGSGKSTLLHLIAGLEEPTTGTVSVEPGPPPALMFQDHALFPWLTAGGNVELPLKLRELQPDRHRTEAARLLGLVQLADRYDTPVHELSGGQRQRVALARALAQNSQLLLMDEPFGALDAITRDDLHEVFADVWRQQGLTVVFVTHDVREALRLGTRIVLLSTRPGRIAHQWRSTEGAVADEQEITERLRKEVHAHA